MDIQWGGPETKLMKKLLFILLPAVVFAQAPYRNDTTVTLYYAAPTSYISLANAVSRGLYDDADAPRNPSRYPDYVFDVFEDWRLPIEKISWTGFTHAVLFFDDGNVSQTSPYYEFSWNTSDRESYQRGGGGSTTEYEQIFIDSAHANGVKVLTIIQAVSPTNLNYVTDDSSRIDIFVDSVASYIVQRGFDGVSLNWEGWAGPIQSDTNKIAYLLYRLREELDAMDPPGVLESAPGAADYNYRYPRQAVNDCVDILHMQTYIYTPGWDTRYGRGTTWWECPVYSDSWDTANFQALSTAWGPNSWIARGYDARNLGLLFPALGRIFKQTQNLYGLYDAAPSGDSTVGIDVTYLDRTRFLNNGGSDTTSTATYGYAVQGVALEDQIGTFAGRNIHAGWEFFVTFMDSLNVAKAVEYGRDTVGLTHFAIFSLTNDPAQEAHRYFAAQFSGGSSPTPYALGNTLSAGTVGVAYQDTVAGSGPVVIDYRVMVRGLPPGLWMDYLGIIRGTPQEAGAHTFWVMIQDRHSRLRRAWTPITLTINEE